MRARGLIRARGLQQGQVPGVGRLGLVTSRLWLTGPAFRVQGWGVRGLTGVWGRCVSSRKAADP